MGEISLEQFRCLRKGVKLLRSLQKDILDVRVTDDSVNGFTVGVEIGCLAEAFHKELVKGDAEYKSILCDLFEVNSKGLSKNMLYVAFMSVIPMCLGLPFEKLKGFVNGVSEKDVAALQEVFAPSVDLVDIGCAAIFTGSDWRVGLIEDLNEHWVMYDDKYVKVFLPSVLYGEYAVKLVNAVKESTLYKTLRDGVSKGIVGVRVFSDGKGSEPFQMMFGGQYRDLDVLKIALLESSVHPVLDVGKKSLHGDLSSMRNFRYQEVSKIRVELIRG